jgi:hypothetical protein
MRSRLLLFLLLIPALVACGKKDHRPRPGKISGEPIVLTYKLAPGDVWTYDVDVANRFEAGQGRSSVEMKMRFIMKMELGELDAEGRAAVELSYETVSMESRPPLPESSMPDLSKLKMRFRLAPDGRIADFVVENGDRAITAEQRNQLGANLEAAFRLPERAVRVNDPWELARVVPFVLPGTDTVLEVDSRLESWIDRYDDAVAHITSAGETSLPEREVVVGEDALGEAMRVSSKGSATSYLSFDRERGVLAGADNAFRSTLRIASGPDKTVMKTDLKMTMRLRGPVTSSL